MTACITEPFCGWIDNFHGPTAIVATHGKGICHTLLCDPNVTVDLIPADMVSYASVKNRHTLMFLLKLFL